MSAYVEDVERTVIQRYPIVFLLKFKIARFSIKKKIMRLKDTRTLRLKSTI
jgi:hypothetical protein